MLSERLFSIHKFLLELLRNRVTTSQKHCTTVSRCFGGFKLWYWNALNDLKVLRNLWKNVSIPFEWRSQRLALVLTALALELKKEGIDDTVCPCIVFYLGGEKKARQVFSAKKCKLDFQRGYYWFVRDGGYVGGQKQKHFSSLGSKLYFHVNSSRKILLYWPATWPPCHIISCGRKPRILHSIHISHPVPHPPPPPPPPFEVPWITSWLSYKNWGFP